MPTCRAMAPFAFWIDRVWMVGSLSDWRNGWITLAVVRLDDRRNPRKKVIFNVGWNGKRFADSKEAEKLAGFEDEFDALVYGLRKKLSGPGMEMMQG